MLRHTLMFTLVLALGVRAEDPKPNAAFEQMKKMVGDWTAPMDMGDGKTMDAAFNYRLTAGGSALVETLFQGSEHEMMSVYYVDKGELVLTHYCHLQNQPHMEMDEQTDPKVLSFTCVGAGNTASCDEAHMHLGKFTWTDDDHVTAEWTLFQAGKPADHAVKLDLTRKK